MRASKHLHQFLVPAYGHSPYLKECLASLRAQSHPSPILIATSTPFDGISDIAKAFDADIFIHSPNKGIAHDWNTGFSRVDSEWVTIAHQDDIYLPSYTASILDAVKRHDDLIMAFTDYAEILSDGTRRTETTLLNIKKILLTLGFLGRQTISDHWSKCNMLRFGSPVPCPAVTMRARVGHQLFEQGFRLNMDWAAWLSLARMPGGFAWLQQELVLHRIHPDSETSSGIKGGYRKDEDLQMLRRIWPKPIAHLIASTYSIAYRSNHH